ncbi:hypothetical protein NP233_g12724 [Leucocoprinus birnbaumii]|uniref:Uncharacterized protein n=1 Tax=Leucocoprinus birnbaumii TaxID=56174 RepID=A0AAD5VJJ8_9AGAR|nr:hypothetical protein NP233_g12724 [Leucocoprinus birnbaumii]
MPATAFYQVRGNISVPIGPQPCLTYEPTSRNLSSRFDQYTWYYPAKDLREVRFSKLSPFGRIPARSPFSHPSSIPNISNMSATNRPIGGSSDDMADSRWNNFKSSEDEKEREDAALDRQEEDRVVREGVERGEGEPTIRGDIGMTTGETRAGGGDEPAAQKGVGTHQVRLHQRRQQAAM